VNDGAESGLLSLHLCKSAEQAGIAVDCLREVDHPRPIA